MTMGTCKHGTFDLAEGCPVCIAELQAEKYCASGGIIPGPDPNAWRTGEEEVRLEPEEPKLLVKVQYFSETTGEMSDRQYTYYSEDPLELGDIINVPVRGTITKARVSAVDVPDTEISAFKDKVKTIPAGAIVKNRTAVPELDRMVNLCDTCALRLDYPACTSDDVLFGDGTGNDNIIKCGKYANGPAAPCSIPLNVELNPGGLAAAAQAAGAEVTTMEVTALNLRPGEDIEVLGYYEQSMTALKYAEGRVIATLEDNKAANNDLSLISKLKKAMELKKKEYLEPLKLQTDAIRDTYNYLMGPILEADIITRQKMGSFDQEQKHIRAAQEEINRKRMEAARAEMELKGELSESVNLVEVIPEVKRVSTELGTSSMTAHWTYEVVDFSQVPDAYKVIDKAQLSTIARSHHDSKPIPGVRFYNEPTITNRPR